MLFIDILIGVPLPGQEWMLAADDLPVEERGERGVLFCQTLDLQVAAQVSIVEVNVLLNKVKSASVKLMGRLKLIFHFQFSVQSWCCWKC